MSAISDPNGIPGGEFGGAKPWPLPALLLGVVVGASLQLQQPQLWHSGAYGGLLLAGLGVVVWGWRAHRRAVVFAAAALALFALCGLRAAHYKAEALQPALEGQDIRITAVVAAMPQANEAGTRLRLAVEGAQLGGQPVRLPPRIDVTWYGSAFRDGGPAADLAHPPPALRAGERWDMTVRLKAPHGLRNPHGFDLELWLWEQGVQGLRMIRPCFLRPPGGTPWNACGNPCAMPSWSA